MTSRPVLLGGYAAKRCARATHNSFDREVRAQWARINAENPELVPAPAQWLMDLGTDHEAEVFVAWAASGVDVADLRSYGMDEQAHVAATLRALAERRAVVLGGRLPDDAAGGRTGKPDVLIREASGTGYHPCDVKAHRVLDGPGAAGPVSNTASPALAGARASDSGLRQHEGDLLQLAHYWRMLEACGHQAASPWGAVVGTDTDPLPVLAWYDLTAPSFTTFSRSRGSVKRSALERYDHEHGFRVRIARVAEQRTGGSGDPEPLVTPVGQEECSTCSWKPVCIDTLPIEDVSRGLPGKVRVREYLALRREGIQTLDDLADADVEDLLDTSYASETTPDRGRAQRLRKAQHAARLLREGVTLRLRPGASFDVRRADVEVDLDIEWTRDGRVYLWGLLVTTSDGSRFQPFLDQEVDDDASERALAQRCFDWLRSHHPDAAVYHYSHVEKTQARRILGPQIEAYTGSVGDPETWIDLRPPVRACVESRIGLGLKDVATEGAGFRWRDADPGGLQSQDWFDQARAGDPGAIERILAYNEDDVRATLAVRTWLADATVAQPADDPLAPGAMAP